MKSDFQPRPSDSRGRKRGAVLGAMQIMSERQTQAYLMARDTIRRIQRTSSMFDSNSRDAARRSSDGGGRPSGH